MVSKLVSRRDIEFLLYEWMDTTELIRRARFAEHSRETFDASLDTAERIATELFAPHNRKADLNEPSFDGTRVHIIPEVKTALKAFSAAGFNASAKDHALGGMQLPTVVEQACLTYFLAANAGTTGYPFLSIANSNLLVAHGSPAQIDTFARPVIDGRFSGTMCLSEPQAGSSLGDIRTRASPDGASPWGPRYRLFGGKMWISGGDHELYDNIIHLVLARTPDAPPGSKGISLFIVPKVLINANGSPGERNDVALAGINHKMGYRGTVNTLLNFGEGRFTPEGRAGAIGYLVGDPHKGLSYMFHMMNEARIGVGLGATALAYTAYLHALEYARSRPQGRRIGARNPATPQVNIIEHPDVRRMLLAQKACAEGALALNLYCSRLVDDKTTASLPEDRARATLLLEILTPICKSWPSQWAQESISHAIQIHGGYGYTRDYPVEQFYRDNRLNPIHEGTHGIQAIDLLGRKVVMDQGAALLALHDRISDTIGRARASSLPLEDSADVLENTLNRIVSTTARLHDAGDEERKLGNATLYLEAFGHLVLAWIWLDQALTTEGKVGDFYEGKRQACHYFYRFELPGVGPRLDLLDRLDQTTLDMQDTWF
ncbi:MAG: acyl-CoA dehydrogenase [Proteobacteria bacterium]|nr:acyl-CoA dehydrogenase [Pseudomonadota bacterium]HQR04405.1 acyl-CoA dehydrogenase [Rhodocyclaceae bacterium]